MTQFIITIVDEDETEHYRRRFQTDDVSAIIARFDQSLNVRVRKPRRDKGQPRTPSEQ